MKTTSRLHITLTWIATLGIAGVFLFAAYEKIADPRERLQEALSKVRRWQLTEWKEERDALGDELGKLLGGADRKKYDKARDAVIELLARARGDFSFGADL